MLRYVTQRLLALVPTLLGISVIIFVVLHLIPGDPALILAGSQADPQTVANIRRDLGTDRPLAAQFLSFVGNALRGDLGRSFSTRQPVTREVSQRIFRSLLIAAAATGAATLLGIAAGVLAAARANTWWDTAVMVFSVMGVSVPAFWLGLMLIYLFGIYLQWLPTVGLDSARSLLLPVLVLSLAPLALIARMTRAQMLEVLRHEYVRTAHSKGLSERAVIIRHVIKNALIPVITVIGLALGILLGSAVVVEIVFTIDGLGRLLVTAILARDFPIVQGVVLLLAAAFVLINLSLDLCYGYLDPRIRYD
jgi:ABC-type dipeptide/oligopeptide/nickel transport system permease component